MTFSDTYIQNVSIARRTAADAELTRQAILAAATRSFAEHGFAGTALEAVVAEAGITRGALYHHFPDKVALFQAVFVTVEEDFNNKVLEAVGAVDPEDHRGAVLAGFRAAIEAQQTPEYRQIAIADAPAVLGHDQWHEVDAGIGMDSMRIGLELLRAGGHIAVEVNPALVTIMFGALTELGFAVSRGEIDTVDEALDGMTMLLDRLA